MTKKRPIFYDTETTGIRAERDRIVEIAAYDPYLEKSFVQLVNPGSPIPKEASNIHHITDEMVKEAPPFSEVAPQFTAFCEGDVVLIAHNNDAFDLFFLKYEFQRAGLLLPEWPFLDSLKWARRYRPDLPRHSLQSLREVYGIEANDAHRALDDVMVLYKVFMAMCDDLSMETCLELLSPKEGAPATMPFGKYRGQPLKSLPKSYVTWLASSGSFEKPENHALAKSFISLGLLRESAAAH